MISAVIVDDENPARSRLRRYLGSYPDITIVAELSDGAEALKVLAEKKPDLLFLDIQMPVMNGFELLDRIDDLPAVIFISAYDEYALRAFEVNAVDYLLKPYSQERFRKAVDRAIAEIGWPAKWKDKIENLLSYIREQKSYLTKIPYRSGHFFQIIDSKDVDFFRIEDGCLIFHSGAKRQRVDYTLAQLEERLDPGVFLRVHRNAIANLGRIHRVLPWGQGRIVLDYADSGHLQVSRDKTPLVKTLLGLG